MKRQTQTEDRRVQRMLRSHRQPPLGTQPGRYHWLDGCAVTIDHIYGGFTATTLYHPAAKHQPGDDAPVPA